jgi:hypothetical protein
MRHRGRGRPEGLPGWPGDLPRLEPCYSPAGGDPFFWGDCRGYGEAVKAVAQTSGRATVVAWWVSSIAAHPGAYLSHRLAVARQVLNHGRGAEDVIIMRRPGYDSVHNSARYIANTRSLAPSIATNIQVWEPTTVYRRIGFLANLWDAAFGFPVLWLLGCVSAGLLLTRRLGGRTTDEIAAAAASVGTFLKMVHASRRHSWPCRPLLPTITGFLAWQSRSLSLRQAWRSTRGWRTIPCR